MVNTFYPKSITYLVTLEESFENALTLANVGTRRLGYKLQLSDLALSLWHNSVKDRHAGPCPFYSQPYHVLSNFKANLSRRKKDDDRLTSARLMDLLDPSRAILLSNIAFVFRKEIDDYTQIDFSNNRHVKLLKIAVDNSIAKVSRKQGRPINEALNEFFIGLRDLYESATGKSAVAGAHFDGQPKTDFEKLIYLGYQIIRPAQEYQAALKAYERAISRNS